MEDNSWVTETGKRLREELKVATEGAARQKREEEDRQESFDQERRVLYEHYAQDLQRIKDCIKRLVPELHLNEFCWVVLQRSTVHIGLTAGKQTRPLDSPFTRLEELKWTSCVPTEKIHWFLELFARDIAKWARSADLAVCIKDSRGTQWMEGWMEVPFSMLSHGVYVAGVLTDFDPAKGDISVGLRVPLGE